MRSIRKKQGVNLCIVFMSFFSTYAFAQNPFLDEATSTSAFSDSEIRHLQSEMSNLRRDVDAMFMMDGGRASPPPGNVNPDGSFNPELDGTLNVESEQGSSDFEGEVESYFEVNGVYIIKKNSSNDFGYLEVSPSTFNKLVEKEKTGSKNGVQANANAE